MQSVQRLWRARRTLRLGAKRKARSTWERWQSEHSPLPIYPTEKRLPPQTTQQLQVGSIGEQENRHNAQGVSRCPRFRWSGEEGTAADVVGRVMCGVPALCRSPCRAREAHRSTRAGRVCPARATSTMWRIMSPLQGSLCNDYPMPGALPWAILFQPFGLEKKQVPVYASSSIVGHGNTLPLRTGCVTIGRRQGKPLCTNRRVRLMHRAEVCR
jgi:hypothetical protein